MRTIDADALIDDLKHDVAVDQDSLDYEELTDSNRENIQFDKDCKQNAIDLLQHAPTIEPRCESCETFNKTRLLIPQPQQRWIPCSERLPDDLAEVNITWVNHNPEPYYDFVKDKPATATAVYYKGKWYWYSATCTDYLAEYGTSIYNENVMDKAIEVIAWMPLPEPYKKESR